MERIQVLDTIEKDIVTCLHSAGTDVIILKIVIALENRF